MERRRAPWARAKSQRTDDNEDVLLRQYRYLLTTASLDVVEGAHTEALDGMSGADRQRILTAVRDVFSTGRHLGEGDSRQMAHLIAVGAHKAPTDWIRALDPGLAQELAERTLVAEAAFGALTGYADWDGAVLSSEGPGPNDGFDPTKNRYNWRSDPRFNEHGGL